MLVYFVSCFYFHRGTNFVWAKPNDTLFCREILLHEPFKFKVRSVQRKKAWDMISDNLNAIEDLKFSVTARSVRDRYANLTSRKSTQLKDVERASGIAVLRLNWTCFSEKFWKKKKKLSWRLKTRKNKLMTKKQKTSCLRKK